MSENLKTLLPSNEPPRLKALDVATREAARNLFRKASKTLIDWRDIDRADPELLDLLAEIFGILPWDKNYDEQTKRKRLKTGRQLSKTAGTRYAVQKILDLFVPGSTVEEWFEAGLEPGKMRLNMNRTFEPGEEKRLRALIDRYKNVRTHYEIFINLILSNRKLLLAVTMASNQAKIKRFAMGKLTKMQTQATHTGVAKIETPAVFFRAKSQQESFKGGYTRTGNFKVYQYKTNK